MGKLFIVENSHYWNINDSKYLDVEFGIFPKTDSNELGMYELAKSPRSEYYHYETMHDFSLSRDLFSCDENFQDLLDKIWSDVEASRLDVGANLRILVKEFKFDEDLKTYLIKYRFVYKN